MTADKERNLQHNACMFVRNKIFVDSIKNYAGDVTFTDTYNMEEILNELQYCG